MKHLYEVIISYGVLIVVAESLDEVSYIIKNSEWYKSDFECIIPPKGVDKQTYIDECILKYTEEIAGYEVKGESKIIAYYQE